MAASNIQHFLLVFDHEKGRLVDEKHFGSDSHAAVECYAKLEEVHRGNRLMDIVLVGSDSIETVKLTHANYYDGTASVVSKYLIGI
ncbi:hypothetical protein GCM10009623_08380 [Nocardioides aestuarii]|uniref:Uncharacterized protein n=1 Tax=Nocardioides aestuarii TaxID=252231 RepID=A0ABW4THI5_9ACTN